MAETNIAKKETGSALVPKLRFPEFQNAGEWELASIGKLKHFVTSGSRGWARFYAETGELFVRITNLWRDSIYLDLADSKFVQLPSETSEGVRTQLKEHDVLISITADIGIIGYVDACVPSPAYINQHIALVLFNKEQLCGKYVAYFLASEKSQRLFRASTDTGTKAGMSLTGIQKIQLTLPGLPEQEHIAEFLASVDKLIAAQAQKVEALKTHKKGLMQQLFPREGETQPRLRFPEFQGAGDWEVASIGDLKPFVTSGSRGWARFYAEKGELFVRITNLWRDSIYLDLTDSKFVQLPSEASEGVRTQLKEHDVLISITADIGLIGYVDEFVPSPAYINQHIALVRFDKEQLCGRFVAYFLASEKSQRLFRVSTDTGTKAGMSLIGIQKIQLIFPCLPEQQRIASSLSNLDALITAENQKLEALKTHKKGLMQQLFPSPEEIRP